MKLEYIPIKFKALNLQQVHIDRWLHGLTSGHGMELAPEHLEALTLLSQGVTLKGVADHFFANGTCPPFQSLHRLLEFLVAEELIENAEFVERFSQPEADSWVARISELVFGREEEAFDLRSELKNLPFFRSLKPEMLEIFLQNGRIIKTPRNYWICESGKKARNLYVLLRGQASVYGRDQKKMPVKLVTLTPGSTFGEVGFFLGEPRTADIVTDEKCLVFQISYDEKLFANRIRMSNELQLRIRAIHALLNSELFREIPHDSFDSLVFSGSFRNFAQGQRLCQEGERGATCYAIIRGSAIVSQKAKPIRRLHQGDCFGEVALLLTVGKRTATVECETDMLVLEIQAPTFYQLLANNFTLGCEFERVAMHRMRADKLRKHG